MKISRVNFNGVFIDQSNIKVSFLKKMKSFLVKGFYLKFPKKVTCILNHCWNKSCYNEKKNQVKYTIRSKGPTDARPSIIFINTDRLWSDSFYYIVSLVTNFFLNKYVNLLLFWHYITKKLERSLFETDYCGRGYSLSILFEK